jgi:hypothetical protein
MPITILSSVKPLWSGDQYDQNQKSAIASWLKLGHKPVLFNHREDVLIDGPIYVQPKTNPPSIKELLSWFCSSMDGVVAIVNADIRLDGGVKEIDNLSKKHGNVWAATSFRYDEFDGVRQVTDMGLDFFCFPKNIASRIALDVPECLTLGRGGWDNWMNGWLSNNLQRGRYYDLTPQAFVIHPRHTREDGRLTPIPEKSIAAALSHPRIKCIGIPSKKIRTA